MNQPRRSDTDSINFLVATPRAVTSTEAARVQPRRPHAPAHDAFTRLLHRLEPAPATLWHAVAPLVDPRRGVLVLDDSPSTNPTRRRSTSCIGTGQARIMRWSMASS